MSWIERGSENVVIRHVWLLWFGKAAVADAFSWGLWQTAITTSMSNSVLVLSLSLVGSCATFGRYACWSDCYHSSKFNIVLKASHRLISLRRSFSQKFFLCELDAEPYFLSVKQGHLSFSYLQNARERTRSKHIYSSHQMSLWSQQSFVVHRKASLGGFRPAAFKIVSRIQEVGKSRTFGYTQNRMADIGNRSGEFSPLQMTRRLNFCRNKRRTAAALDHSTSLRPAFL